MPNLHAAAPPCLHQDHSQFTSHHNCVCADNEQGRQQSPIASVGRREGAVRPAALIASHGGQKS